MVVLVGVFGCVFDWCFVVGCRLNVVACLIAFDFWFTACCGFACNLVGFLF